MPNTVPAFECNICRKLYVGSEGETNALNCEKNGTPEYAFEIGETFFLKIAWGAVEKMRVVERKIILVKEIGHVPAYWLASYFTGQRMNRIITEGELKHDLSKTIQPKE